MEFGILNFLIFRALRGHEVSFKNALILGFLLAVIYAFSDEAHQYFVAERQAKLFDVGVDSLGAALISCLILLFNLHWQTKIKTPV